MRAVPRVHHREGSRPEANSEDKTPATQGQRVGSCSLQHGDDLSCVWEPLRGTISPDRLFPLHSVSKQSPAGLSRLQRRLRHEDEVPSRAGKRNRSPSRYRHTNARHLDPHLRRPDVRSGRIPPPLSAMFDAPNALMHTAPRVHHREDSRPEASSKEETPDTQGERETKVA